MKKSWIIIILIIGIGGAIYMSKKAEERAELQTIQRDLANHLYNNYRLYTRDEEQFSNLKEEHNQGNGNLTDEEFLEKTDLLKQYVGMETVEFIGFSKHPMGGLEVSYLINDVFPDTTILDTRSHETQEWIYSIGSRNVRNAYALEERESPTIQKFPESNIIYYEGGIK